MLRKRRYPDTSTKFMDAGLISSLEEVSATVEDGFLVKAVLFGSGELRRLERSTDVYGLVLASYQGLRFGDDGTYTGLLASELALDEAGLRCVESEIDEAVRRVNPVYCAEFVGYIALDDAAIHLDIATKRNLGVKFPNQVSWSNGSLYTT